METMQTQTPIGHRMGKTIVEIDIDCLNKIIIDDLSFLLDRLQEDLGQIQETKKGWVFSTDWEEDVKQVKKHIKAFKRVLRYYGWEEL